MDSSFIIPSREVTIWTNQRIWSIYWERWHLILAAGLIHILKVVIIWSQKIRSIYCKRWSSDLIYILWEMTIWSHWKIWSRSWDRWLFDHRRGSDQYLVWNQCNLQACLFQHCWTVTCYHPPCLVSDKNIMQKLRPSHFLHEILSLKVPLPIGLYYTVHERYTPWQPLRDCCSRKRFLFFSTHHKLKSKLTLCPGSSLTTWVCWVSLPQAPAVTAYVPGVTKMFMFSDCCRGCLFGL